MHAVEAEHQRATEAELEQYARDGYFVRESAFDESELEPLREAVDGVHDQIVRAVGTEKSDAIEHIDDKRYQKILDSSVQWEWRGEVAEIRSMEPYHHLDERLDRLTDDARLWSPCRPIVRSDDVSLFSDKLNFKRPHGAPFPWHQDTPYWAFQCNHLDQLVSVSIYLDRATRENGCIWVIPGSHVHGTLPCYEDRGRQGKLYTDVDRYEGREPVALEAPAGTVMYFHGDLIHGSQSNRSTVQRRALLLTYQPAGYPRWQHEDVRPVPDTPTS
jgi:hypothetical protein